MTIWTMTTDALSHAATLQLFMVTLFKTDDVLTSVLQVTANIVFVVMSESPLGYVVCGAAA